MLWEQSAAEEASPGPGDGAESCHHGCGLRRALIFLPPGFDVVAPDQEDGETFEGSLAALAEGDGLASMIGAGVTQQQIEEVDGEEGVALGAAGGSRGYVVVDVGSEGVSLAQAAESAAVGGMVIGVEDQGVVSDMREERGKQGRHAELDGLWVRATEGAFEEGPFADLVWGHGALAAQRAVGEVVEQPAASADGEVGVEGEELGELEGLEAVDDEGFGEGEGVQEQLMEEEAVASATGEGARDGGVGGIEEARDLAQASA